MGKIISLNISREKGVNKEPVESVEVRIDHGIVGDAHAGDWHRQISLLAEESIDFMRAKGLELTPGAFAENITTEGIELAKLPLGTRMGSGEVVLADPAAFGLPGFLRLNFGCPRSLLTVAMERMQRVLPTGMNCR